MSSLTQLLARMAAAFPRDNVPGSTIRVYEDALSDLKPEVLEGIILGCIQSATRFPTIADIRQAYDDEREAQALRKREQYAALPEGPGSPMPDWFKAEMANLNLKMDERAKELESEDA